MRKVFVVIDHEDIIQVYDNRTDARKHCADINLYYDSNSCRVVEMEIKHSY